MRSPTFAGFPTFWPMTTHFLESYSLIADKRAALCINLVSVSAMEHRILVSLGEGSNRQANLTHRVEGFMQLC
jgi:hypothetical protein